MRLPRLCNTFKCPELELLSSETTDFSIDRTGLRMTLAGNNDTMYWQKILPIEILAPVLFKNLSIPSKLRIPGRSQPNLRNYQTTVDPIQMKVY